MISHRIVAIRKPDRNSTHEHITHVQYDNLIHKVEEVISLIERATNSFYVTVGNATSLVTVVRPLGFLRRPYIRTTPDWTGKDNLLKLPEC